MTAFAFASHVSLSSDNLKLLQVWEDWCRDQKFDGSSEEAQIKAKSLIDWFQFGIDERHQLRSLLNPL